MFTFFQKKKFLVDYLEGFVDIHNHILPGIDDGAKTVDESIELIKGFSEFGVKNFICTPHVMHHYYENTPETIKASYQKLKTALIENQMGDISIDYAAEYMIDDNFENLLDKNLALPIGKNHLLVEMSYLQPPINFEEAIQQIASNRLFTILAHPERYIYLNSDKYNAYKNSGIVFQLNLLSLTEFYGKEVQKTANKLLQDNLFDLVATDVHNIRQLEYIKSIKVPSKMLNELLGLIRRTETIIY